MKERACIANKRKAPRYLEDLFMIIQVAESIKAFEKETDDRVREDVILASS